MLLCVALAGAFYLWVFEFSPVSQEPSLRPLFLFFNVSVALIILFDLYGMVRGFAGSRMHLGTNGQELLLGRPGGNRPAGIGGPRGPQRSNRGGGRPSGQRPSY